MSDQSRVDAVSSGTPYSVSAVDGRPPQNLDDFVAEDVVTLIINNEAQEVIVQGSAVRTEDTVLVYEKDGAGSGKDVRTWRVHWDGGAFGLDRKFEDLKKRVS